MVVCVPRSPFSEGRSEWISSYPPPCEGLNKSPSLYHKYATGVDLNRYSSRRTVIVTPNCDPEPSPRTVTGKKKNRHKLTWAAATERLADAAVMNVGESKRQKPVADNFFTVAHAAAGSGPTGDLFRLVTGADSAAWQVRRDIENRGNTYPSGPARPSPVLQGVPYGSSTLALLSDTPR